jgi:hypothetical protein
MSVDRPALNPDNQLILKVSWRELATILAALRFHQDENLQCTEEIPDQMVADIATDGGTLIALNRTEVERLRQKLNCVAGPAGLNIDERFEQAQALG